MPKIAYTRKNFSVDRLLVIQRANELCESYERQGFTLTLRQLYYQFVARGWIPNRDAEYKKLGDIISDGRRAGLIDWYHLEDRTRFVRSNTHWNSPADIVRAAAASYDEDRWVAQEYRVEAWIEKDALVGVLGSVCPGLDVPFFSCRGYTSDSEVWRAAQRLRGYERNGQTPVILHFGDHDPSGIDMTRDIIDRLRLFSGLRIEVERLALNMDQIDRYNPPPNPAKVTDSRYASYVDVYGEESWELDALEPSVIVDLVQTAVDRYRDRAVWDARDAEIKQRKQALDVTREHWEELQDIYADRGWLDTQEDNT